MPAGHISKSAGSGSRRVRSCNHCRQFKIRCDSTEVFPSPCSACKAKDRDCSVDSTFKPIRTRSLLKDVTSQLTLIHGALRDHDITIPRPSFPEYHPPRDIPEQPRLETEPTPAVLGPLAGSKDDLSYIGSQKLGDIVVEADTIRDLFEHFRRNHYLYFPILNKDFSPTQLVQSCPLLFWTVLVISSRYHRQHSSIYRNLFAPYKEILSNALVNSVRSVRVIQAILYICLWPMRVRNQLGDPSVTYCGAAVNAALQLGIHRQVLGKENLGRDHGGRSFVGDSEERMRTWKGCIYVSTHMSIMHELPLQLPIRLYLDTMNAIVTRDGISEFNALVLIHCQTAKLVSGLEGGFDPLACNTFIALFERELDLIKTTFRQVWSTELEISLLAAKLFVYDLSLCHIGRLSSSAGRDRNLKPGELVILTYGLTAATRIIDIFNRSALEDLAIHAVGSLRSQICYPKSHFMLMVFAALFLFRVIGLPSQLERSDINLARSKVQTAINVHRRSVREPGDEHERMAALFEVLARIEPSFYLEHFRSEYSRSLIFECQRLASDRRHHHFPQVQASEDQSGPAGVSQEPQSVQSQATADPSPLDTDHTSQGLMNVSDFDSAEIPWGIWDNMIFDSLSL